MTIQRMVELLKIEHECMLREAHDDCDRDCANCGLAQDEGELHEMYISVIALLNELGEVEPKRQYARKSSGHGMEFWYECGSCGTEIMKNDKFCHECRKRVKWKI